MHIGDLGFSAIISAKGDDGPGMHIAARKMAEKCQTIHRLMSPQTSAPGRPFRFPSRWGAAGFGFGAGAGIGVAQVLKVLRPSSKNLDRKPAI